MNTVAAFLFGFITAMLMYKFFAYLGKRAVESGNPKGFGYKARQKTIREMGPDTLYRLRREIEDEVNRRRDMDR